MASNFARPVEPGPPAARSENGISPLGLSFLSAPVARPIGREETESKRDTDRLRRLYRRRRRRRAAEFRETATYFARGSRQTEPGSAFPPSFLPSYREFFALPEARQIRGRLREWAQRRRALSDGGGRDSLAIRSRVWRRRE